MPQTEARPPAKNRYGGAPRGARPSVEGRKALRSAPGLPREMRSRASDAAGPTGAAVPVRLSALRPPLEVGIQFHDPGAIAPRERDVLSDGLFEIVRWEFCRGCCVAARRAAGNSPSPLAGEGLMVVRRIRMGEGCLEKGVLAKRPPHPFIVAPPSRPPPQVGTGFRAKSSLKKGVDHVKFDLDGSWSTSA